MDNLTVSRPLITPNNAPTDSMRKGPRAVSIPPANSRLKTPVINAGASVLVSVAAYDGASNIPAQSPVIAPAQRGDRR